VPCRGYQAGGILEAVVRLLLVTAVVLAAAANAGVAAERYPLFDATYVTDHDHRLAHVNPVVDSWVANVYGSRMPWQVLCARRVQERVARQHPDQRCRGSSPWSREGVMP
jgi:hypothetical protein